MSKMCVIATAGIAAGTGGITAGIMAGIGGTTDGTAVTIIAGGTAAGIAAITAGGIVHATIAAGTMAPTTTVITAEAVST